MKAYPINRTLRLTGSFTTILNALIDPQTVRLVIRDGHSQISTHVYPDTIVKESTGVYHMDIVPTVSGLWTYRWEGIDPSFEAISDPESAFFVLVSQVYSPTQ